MLFTTVGHLATISIVMQSAHTGGTGNKHAMACPSTEEYYTNRTESSPTENSKEDRRRKRREAMGVGNTVTLLESEFDEYKEVMHDRREKIAGEDAERTLRRAKLEQKLNEKGCTEEEKESCRAKLISEGK